MTAQTKTAFSDPEAPEPADPAARPEPPVHRGSRPGLAHRRMRQGLPACGRSDHAGHERAGKSNPPVNREAPTSRIIGRSDKQTDRFVNLPTCVKAQVSSSPRILCAVGGERIRPPLRPQHGQRHPERRGNRSHTGPDPEPPVREQFRHWRDTPRSPRATSPNPAR